MRSGADFRDGDRALDRSLIAALAQEFDRAPTEVEQILREEIASLTVDARIETFVPVLATRRTRHRLRSNGPHDR